jgi:asparagine synthase (glutamine-hydrolysing)
MSGIAGILSSKHHDILPDIIKKIDHRGTTFPFIWEGPMAILGSTTSPPLNEKPGPVTFYNQNQAIIMDGKLSNPDDLLKYLPSSLHETSTDAEIVFFAFEQFGTDVFSKIEGEFALAILDKTRFILARDRLGIRPLYYGFHADTLCFSSEIKGLLNVVDQIHEFPPGHYLISDQGLYPYEPFFPKPVRVDGALESADRLADLLNKTVKSSVPADLRVGVWLDGNVNSSVIAALARPYTNHIHTFALRIKDEQKTNYASVVAHHLGAKHHERILSPAEILANLEKVIFQLETFNAPLVRTMAMNYLVAEMASDYVPLLLSGEGGDELFAGYALQKNYQSEIELILSVQATIASLHNSTLQRVDRSAAAFSLGVGLPFLSPEIVRYALAIPARWKIRDQPDIMKWPLRQGLVEILPEEIIWREQPKSEKNSYLKGILVDFAETTISDNEYAAERDLWGSSQLHSKEELLYYRIFKQHFGNHVPYREIGRMRYTEL